MKNLALVFCSIRPEQLKPSICDYREQEYYQTVQQLERIMPSNYDMVLVENTIDDPNEIKIEAGHDAYLKNFGCTHNRTLSIDKINNKVVGQDKLLQKKWLCKQYFREKNTYQRNKR